MVIGIWRHLPARRKMHIFLLLFLMLAASAAELVSIGMVVPFLGVLTEPSVVFDNRVLSPYLMYFGLNKADDLLFPVTMLFGFFAIFAGLIRVFLTAVLTKTGYLVGAEFGVEIFTKQLNQPYEKHLVQNTSEVIAGITQKTSALVQQGLIAILTLISSSLLLVSIVVVLLLINFKVALTAFGVFGFIYGSLVIFTRPVLEEKGRLVTRMQSQVIRNIQEGLGAIRDIILDGSQAHYIDSYSKSEFALRRAQITHIVISTTPKFIVEAIGMALIAGLAYILISDDNALNAIPTLGALALGSQRLLPILQQIFATLSSFRAGQAAFVDAIEMLDLPDVVENLVEDKLTLQSHLKFNNISFKYASNDRLILDTIDLTIKAGSKVGLIGATGSGKSTFLDILMGLLSPTSGSVSVDNITVTAENRHLWRKAVAHVPQNIFLKDATIMENIAFGEPKEKINVRQVKVAAELAQLSSTIDELGDGLESLVGERGVRLSGGQRQRIGIARALYKGAQVIVFDEATSALDSATEKEVMKSISELPSGITMVIVAHRLGTLDKCDVVYKLDKKSIMRV